MLTHNYNYSWGGGGERDGGDDAHVNVHRTAW